MPEQSKPGPVPATFLVPLYDADESVNIALLFDPPPASAAPARLARLPHAAPHRARHGFLAEFATGWLRRPAV